MTVSSQNPYGFPVSSTGIPIVQQMQDPYVLGSHDVVGTTFWIACASMLASTAFFWFERMNVAPKWKPSLTVSGLVTAVAFWNYTYMRDAWVEKQNSPTVYRYTDWLITVPLLMVEFYMVLKAAMPSMGPGIFYRLLIESTLMLAFGYAGETGIMSVLCGFVLAIFWWAVMIREITSGDAAAAAAACPQKSVRSAYDSMVNIVVYGWAIYPLGYYLTLLGPTATYHEQSFINVSYNIADLVNKTAFGMFVWSAAIMDGGR